MQKNEAVFEKQDGELQVTADGFISIMSDMRDLDISMDVTLNDTSCYLFPKYISEENHIGFGIDENKYVLIYKKIKDKESVIYKKPLADFLEQNNLTFRVRVDGDRIWFFFDGQPAYRYKETFFNACEVRCDVQAGLTITRLELKEPVSKAFEVIRSGEAIVRQVEKGFHLKGTEQDVAGIKQSLHIPQTKHVLSFELDGECFVEAGNLTQHLDGAGERVYCTLRDEELEDFSIKTDSVAVIKKIQVEEDYFTSYIDNEELEKGTSRKHSVIELPVKTTATKNNAGAIYLRYTLQTRTDLNIFKSENANMSLITNEERIQLNVGGQSVEVSKRIGDHTQEVWIAWVDKTLRLKNKLEENETLIPFVNELKTLRFFSELEMTATLHEVALFDSEVDIEKPITELLQYATQSFLFKNGISGKNIEDVEMPVAPIDHSPILVENHDGENMTKVSFFDLETAAYTTRNKEHILYDGISDHIEIAYDEIEKEK
ncbi:MAG: hypothetical protein ACRC5C_10140, partial [Bacilli bacterium]